MPNFHSARPLILLILIPVLLFTGCGSSGSDPDEPPVYSPLQVLVPEAPGKKTLGTSPLVLDISDTDQGYLTAVSDSTDQMMNVQLTAEDGVVYSYFISPGESAVIPFSSGSSTYQVSCYQQISDSQYAALYAQALEVTLENEFLPFLYPNVIQHFIYSQNHSTHVKFNKAPESNKVTYIPSDSLIPEPFMLLLSRTNEKRQATTVQSRPVFPQTAPGVKLPCALTSI